MAEDPVIRNCIAAVEGVHEVSRETAKLTAAYKRLKDKKQVRKSGNKAVQLRG